MKKLIMLSAAILLYSCNSTNDRNRGRLNSQTVQEFIIPEYLILQYMAVSIDNDNRIIVPHYHSPNGRCLEMRLIDAIGTAVRYVPILDIDTRIPVCSHCIPFELWQKIYRKLSDYWE